MLAGWRGLALAAVVLGLFGSAEAGGRAPPWSGGAANVTPFEAKASAVAGRLAGAEVSVECVDPASWRKLGARLGFDPARTWALTPLHWDSEIGRAVPDGYARFSPRACRFGDSFAGNPRELGTRTCQVGTRTRRTARRYAKPTAAGTPKVVTRVAVYGDCDDWPLKLIALHVLTHESMHLRGFVGEADAECLAVQLDAYVATALGADEKFARSLAREFWIDRYAVPGNPDRRAECRGGRALDLFPARLGWPTPSAYPSNLSARLDAELTQTGTGPTSIP